MAARIDLNYDKLDALLQFKVSLVFAANYLGVSEDTIQRRLKEDHDMTFTQYHRLQMENTAVKLQQKAVNMALNGNTQMLDKALKNMANWSDKQEVQQVANININIDSDDADI